MGRADSTVKIRAFKVGMGMVENSIAILPGVASAAVRTFETFSLHKKIN
jgi:acyl-coenzyme A synthetase/AMP-(fatty) acid ligase